MLRFRNILFVVIGFVFILFVNSCSTKRNTFLSRKYHNITTHYNVYFNGKESFREGEQKVKDNHRENYCYLLPLFLSDDEVARKTAYSNMERAVVKAQKAIKLHSITRKPRRRNNNYSKKYKQFRQKKEYNIYIDDCYLLIGKGNFYNKKYSKADNAFAFIVRQFPGTPIVYEAKIWHIRSLTEQKKYTQAQLLIKNLENDKKLSGLLREEYYKVRADYMIKTGDLPRAIEEVQRLVNIVSNRKEKVRYRFILAQLYLNNGMDDMAMNLFGKIATMRISYDMAFNASVNMALAYNGADGQKVRRTLVRMLRDVRNRDFKDQIYYALGNLEFKDGNIEKGIECLNKSTKFSINNDIQKSLSFRFLGDYYFENKDYINAFSCYDSCLYFNATNIENEKELLKRKNNLSDLVDNLNVINTQDSLQRLALMSAKQRDNVIQKIIDKIVEKEEKLLQEEKDARLDRSFYLQNRGNAGIGNSGNDAQGGWYFYNPVSITMGRSEFVRKWGKRKSEDNWRRRNKAIVDIELVDNDEWSGKMAERDNAKVNLKSKEYYLRNIPLTEADKKISDSLIVEALFTAAEIFKEKFNDYENSLKTYNDLINRFPNNKYLMYSYYNSYEISNLTMDYRKAGEYKSRLIEKYPDSEYAKILKNPDYLLKHKRDVGVVDGMYEEAFKAYSNYSFNKSISIVDKALDFCPKSDIADRLLMLKALCVGRLYSTSEFVSALNLVLAHNPDEEIKYLAEKLIMSVEKGGVPVVYTKREVDNARFLENHRDWNFSDISLLKDKAPTPIYKYEDADDYYMVLSVTCTAKDVKGLRFHLNYLAEDVIDSGVVQVRKEQIGLSNTLFVLRGLKNKDEGIRLLSAIASSKKISKIIGKLDYRLFFITAENYKILQYSQDVGVYVDFFVSNYLKEREDADLLVGKRSGIGNIFSRDMSANHRFVILYPYRKVQEDIIVKSLKDFDADYEVVSERYDVEYGLAIVNNVGNRTDAVRYLMGFKTYFKNNYNEISGLCDMMVITDTNYDIFYSNKYFKEYSGFFDENYNIEEVDLLNGKRIKDGEYIYEESSIHYFAIVYPSEVDNNKIEQDFKRYNISELGLSISPFGRDKNILLVSNLKDKKQAMMYLRAVITNRKLFKELKNEDYYNFVISEENLNVLTKNHKLKEYMIFFKKWYLNR